MFLARPFRIPRGAHPIVVALATAAEGVLETLGEIQMDNPVVDPIDVLAGANAVGVTAQNEALLMPLGLSPVPVAGATKATSPCMPKRSVSTPRMSGCTGMGPRSTSKSSLNLPTTKR